MANLAPLIPLLIDIFSKKKGNPNQVAAQVAEDTKGVDSRQDSDIAQLKAQVAQLGAENIEMRKGIVALANQLARHVAED